jgi:hypothetical protein
MKEGMFVRIANLTREEYNLASYAMINAGCREGEWEFHPESSDGSTLQRKTGKHSNIYSVFKILIWRHGALYHNDFPNIRECSQEYKIHRNFKGAFVCLIKNY